MLNSKSQIPNSATNLGGLANYCGEPKQGPISNIRISNQRTMFRSFGIWNCILFVICGLCIGIYNSAYALNLDKIKIYFLEGNYQSAILEGEKILASHGYSSDPEGLYYILGLSYLKDGNYLRASDIFEIILKEYKESRFKDEAKFGLGDTYFLREDFKQAKYYYFASLKDNPKTKLKAQLYVRLSQIGFKRGDTGMGREYLDKLKQDFPLSLEGIPTDSNAPPFYTVQVGSFANSINAKNLRQKLIQQGYPAYIEEIDSFGKISYRVRVGKSTLRQEILDLERKLSQQGYPTKMYP